jgi:hypothetical protein
MEIDGQMHNGEAKITNLVEEQLQTEGKNQNWRERVKAESRKGN